MALPFANLFKKVSARFFAPAPQATSAPIRLAPVEKAPGERLSKTVMPNVIKTVSAPDPFRTAAGSSTMARVGRDLAAPISFGSQPKGERTISLQLRDILDQLPADYTKKPESFDVSRAIALKASEVEKGMASGRPAVLLASVYEQAPDIFWREVEPGNTTNVELPYDKVLAQFQNFQVRSDQMADQAVPQVDTPILQVTLEDTAKFGTTLAPIQTSALPPVKVELATAKTISRAEPEAVAREKASPAVSGRVTIPLTTDKNRRSDPNESGSSSPARIPFRLPPNGAGEPASERVPASSGPPVPTSRAKSSSPKVPFKIPAPCAELRPKFTLVPGVDPDESAVDTEKDNPEQKEQTKIALPLQPVLRNVPAFQLVGTLPEIPADVRIELPYALIEPQLASGRIAIDPKIFQKSLPETYRNLFSVDPTETPVLLPLQEVLNNLPATALRMRADQQQEEAVDYFETPFSIQAQEDEQRFRSSGGAIKKDAEAPAQPEANQGVAAKTELAPAEKAEEKLPVAAIEPAPSEADPAAANAAKEQDQPPKEEKKDAKEFVTRATELPGVAGCAITFADGLSLAGNLPPDIAAEGLCAMAPSLLQKIEKHMLDTKLGPFIGMTLHCAKSPMTFFMQGNVCLTVVHTDRQLETTTQEKLTEMVKELSQIYTQPEIAHVDH